MINKKIYVFKVPPQVQWKFSISNRLQWWVEHHQLLPEGQTGFRKGLSCADNLATFKLDIKEALWEKEQVMTVFLDVSNAFNDVHIVTSYHPNYQREDAPPKYSNLLSSSGMKEVFIRK